MCMSVICIENGRLTGWGRRNWELRNGNAENRVEVAITIKSGKANYSTRTNETEVFSQIARISKSTSIIVVYLEDKGYDTAEEEAIPRNDFRTLLSLVAPSTPSRYFFTRISHHAGPAAMPSHGLSRVGHCMLAYFPPTADAICIQLHYTAETLSDWQPSLEVGQSSASFMVQFHLFGLN